MEVKTGEFYEVGVVYDKTQEDGLVKKVKETYAVDAISFAEGENNAVNEMAAYTAGEFEVAKMRKAPYGEIVLDSGEKYYKVTFEYITIDEVSGKEKRTKAVNLVEAPDVEKALQTFLRDMKGIMGEYEVRSIVLTPIVDVMLTQKKDEEA